MKSSYGKPRNQVTRSTPEAEFLGISTFGKEALYIRNVLNFLGHQSKTPLILNDNDSAIRMSKDLSSVDHCRHLDFAWFLTRKGEEYVEHIGTKLLLADSMTKPLARSTLEKFRKVILSSASMEIDA